MALESRYLTKRKECATLNLQSNRQAKERALATHWIFTDGRLFPLEIGTRAGRFSFRNWLLGRSLERILHIYDMSAAHPLRTFP